MSTYKFGKYNSAIASLHLKSNKNFITNFDDALKKSGQLFNITAAPFLKTFIIRGIGYRAQVINNNWLNSNAEWSLISDNEFSAKRYLSIRVGYSYNIYLPIPNHLGVLISKKDRKLVVYGAEGSKVSTFSKLLYNLRSPSVYTGRGIRYKKFLHKRKVGKKDVRKGRFF